MDSSKSLLSSSQLLNRVREGDDDALEALYRRYLGPLRRWARGRLPRWARSVVDTDDLVQESLLGSLRTVQRFVPERSGAFQSYLRGALKNRLTDELRRVRRRPQGAALAAEYPDGGLSPVEEAIGREALRRFGEAMGRLGPRDRDAVVARVELGLPYKEIADILGTPTPDAARMCVQRAIARLAKEMAAAP